VIAMIHHHQHDRQHDEHDQPRRDGRALCEDQLDG
jgi:hypothetical protein